jgi:nucleotide-binding universal stress UspA family protein
MRLRSIVCPVDFSAPSRQAFEYALALAARANARLTVVHAIEPLLAQAAAATFDDAYLRDTRDELVRFTSRPGPGSGAWMSTPTYVVSVGEPWKQILRAAETHDADLIVMATQGLGGVRRLVFGSTAEHVLRAATVPVLVIPRGARHLRFDADGPALDLPLVAAAVDLGPGAPAVARLAARVAEDFGAHLLLVHAVRPVEALGRWDTCRTLATSVARATADAALEAVTVRLDTTVPIETAIVVGQPADVCCDLATTRGASLIVMGTASTSGSHRPGSTAYRALCLTEIPVLAVPPATGSLADRVHAGAGSQEVW